MADHVWCHSTKPRLCLGKADQAQTGLPSEPPGREPGGSPRGQEASGRVQSPTRVAGACWGARGRPRFLPSRHRVKSRARILPALPRPRDVQRAHVVPLFLDSTQPNVVHGFARPQRLDTLPAVRLLSELRVLLNKGGD